MLLQEKLIKELAKKYNKSPEVVKSLVYFPFKFAKEKMENISDDRPIRIRYFGIFRHKYMKNKKYILRRKSDIMIENLEDVAVMMSTTLGFIIKDFDSAKRIINEACDAEDYDKIELIWDGWNKYKYS